MDLFDLEVPLKYAPFKPDNYIGRTFRICPSFLTIFRGSEGMLCAIFAQVKTSGDK